MRSIFSKILSEQSQTLTRLLEAGPLGVHPFLCGSAVAETVGEGGGEVGPLPIQPPTLRPRQGVFYSDAIILIFITVKSTGIHV